MEKFWISSTERNLLSHDIGYIRVAALRGGGREGDLCHWTQLLAHFSSSGNFEGISDRHHDNFSSGLETFMGEFLIVMIKSS